MIFTGGVVSKLKYFGIQKCSFYMQLSKKFLPMPKLIQIFSEAILKPYLAFEVICSCNNVIKKKHDFIYLSAPLVPLLLSFASFKPDK